MKSILLILSLILFCLPESRTADIIDIADNSLKSVVCASSPEKGSDYSPHSTLCLTSSTGWCFSGGNQTLTPPVRTVSSPRRVHSSTSTAFRVVKAGRLTDRQYFSAFLSLILNNPSGIHTTERYLFSIRHLLI